MSVTSKHYFSVHHSDNHIDSVLNSFHASALLLVVPFRAVLHASYARTKFPLQFEDREKFL
jgi:hypothetical protein